MCKEEVIKESGVIHLSIVRPLTVNVKPADLPPSQSPPAPFLFQGSVASVSWHKVIIMSKAKGKKNLVPLPRIF